ncbi:MAG: ADP-ribosylglycohydrolase family protein [Clostridia bacterium]|nr:ADP-ribosylglycohydrolase family protein [Clostridia bacterium]
MSKLYDAMMGFVVADALGVPFEFKERDSFCAQGMVGYGTHGQPVGTWSDDSSMMLATLESLGRCGRIDFKDIMQNFVSWMNDAAFTAHGELFDIGGTTRRAIEKYDKHGKVRECGERGRFSNGNGSLMRILPLAFVPHTSVDVYDVSALTHAHEISVLSCRYYLQVAEGLLDGVDKTEAVRSLTDCEGEFVRLPEIDKCRRDQIRSTGYVVDTLEAALWCLLTTESYRDCVLTAVNLGDDTDTVAAVAGGLAGILYGVGGEKGIPTEWIEAVARAEWITALCETLIPLKK